MKTEHKKPTIRIRPATKPKGQRSHAYTGWYNELGERILCQGPRRPLLRDLEPPGDYPDPSIEKPLWHVLKRWNASFDYDALLSKEDAVSYLRMRYFEDPDGFPDWHKIADWVRAYLRGEDYRSIGKSHFLRQPPVKHLHDSGDEGDEDGISAEEKLEWFAHSQHRQKGASLNCARRDGETEQADFFESANKQPRENDLSPEEQRELEERCRRGIRDEFDLERQAQGWFLKEVFWNYLDSDPTLKKECQDIAETGTWQQRADRWGVATRGAAQKHAHNALKKRLLAVSEGKAVKVLLQLMRVLGVPIMSNGKRRRQYEGPREVYKDNWLQKMETSAIAAPYMVFDDERQKAGIGVANQL